MAQEHRHPVGVPMPFPPNDDDILGGESVTRHPAGDPLPRHPVVDPLPRHPAGDPSPRHPAERSDSQGPDSTVVGMGILDSATSRRMTGEEDLPVVDPSPRHPAERSDSQGPDTTVVGMGVLDSATSRRMTGGEDRMTGGEDRMTGGEGVTTGGEGITTEEIVTLPTVFGQPPPEYPLSARTGEPRHPAILAVASVLCWLSVPVTIVAYVRWWLASASITGFHGSARLLTWTQPDPVSALAIIMVILISLITLLMVVAAGVAAYNSWTGQSWVRIGVWVCLAVMGLSFLLNNWFSVAMIPVVLGGLLLLLPQYSRFCRAMVSFRGDTIPEVPISGIKYGPQPLIGSRD